MVFGAAVLLFLDGLCRALHVGAMSKQKTIYVCINKRGGRACIGPQSREVFRALRQYAKDRAEAGAGDVAVERFTCLGECGHGPNVKILGGPVFNEVGLDDFARIFAAAERVKLPGG